MIKIDKIFKRLKVGLSLVIPISRKIFTSNNTEPEPGMTMVIDAPTEKSLSIQLTDGSILKLQENKITLLSQEGTVRVIADGLITSKHLTPAFELETTDTSVSIDSRKWDMVAIGSDLY